MNATRCGWCTKSDLERDYHDREWGVPATDDKTQFEFLTLESAQAGLSWVTILKKRENYRKCFAGFNAEIVATFGRADVERLLKDASIVRNRLKIESAISNARIFLDLAAKHGSFSHWFWNFCDARPVINRWTDLAQIPATSQLSDAVAREMKRLGFKFIGSTILYAHMQATGMVNDHLVSCFRHRELTEMAEQGLSL